MKLISLLFFLFLGLNISAMAQDASEPDGPKSGSDKQQTIETVSQYLNRLAADHHLILCQEYATEDMHLLKKKLSISVDAAKSLLERLKPLSQEGLKCDVRDEILYVASPNLSKTPNNPFNTTVNVFQFKGTHEEFLRKMWDIFPELPPIGGSSSVDRTEGMSYELQIEQQVTLRDILIQLSSKYKICWFLQIASKTPEYLYDSPTGVVSTGSRVRWNFRRCD